MTVTKQNITTDFYSGNYKELRVTIVDANDDPFDLTGAEVSFSLFEYEEEPDILLVKSSYNGSGEIEILAPATQGIAVIKLDPDDTVFLTGTFRYHVDVTDANGHPEIVTTGRIEIFKSYARRYRNTSTSAYVVGG